LKKLVFSSIEKVRGTSDDVKNIVLLDFGRVDSCIPRRLEVEMETEWNEEDDKGAS
jgi:hypothetical protein